MPHHSARVRVPPWRAAFQCSGAAYICDMLKRCPKHLNRYAGQRSRTEYTYPPLTEADLTHDNPFEFVRVMDNLWVSSRFIEAHITSPVGTLPHWTCRQCKPDPRLQSGNKPWR